MRDDSDIPLDRHQNIIGPDGSLRGSIITCGYCSQGRHRECRGIDCDCARNNHKIGSPS